MCYLDASSLAASSGMDLSLQNVWRIDFPGNLNCFFNLAAEMVGALVIGGISYGLYMISKNAFVTIPVISAVLILSGVICVLKGISKARKNIELLK